MAASLSGLFVYPIKSLAGFAVQDWPVTDRGLKYDRRWMLVDEHNRFLSQRTLPQMARLKTRIEQSQLIVSAPDLPELALATRPTDYQAQISVQLWRHQLPAWQLNPEFDLWFSRALGQACRLVYQPEESLRRVSPAYAKPGDIAAFSDGYPFLLVSQASLDALNRRLAEPVSAIRFRPNLLIETNHAFAEDSWRKIQIGAISFRLPKPCSRCPVPNVDPETGQRRNQPMTTLAEYRKWQGKVYFGQNAIHDQTGTLAVGDALSVLETGPAQPPLNA